MLNITYEKNPHSQNVKVLNNGISEQAKKKKNMLPLKFFGFFIRDVENKIVGGCSGNSMYGSLYIDALWVAETLRGQGYGTRLMETAEKLAKENKYNFMTVNTMDWEALDFYKKLGFYVEFERRGYANNSTFYFLRKDFSEF